MKRYSIEIYNGSAPFQQFTWSTVKEMVASDKHDGIPEEVVRSFHNYKRNNPEYKYRLVEVFFWTDGSSKPLQSLQPKASKGGGTS